MTCPILSVAYSANHTFWSGPVVIPEGPLDGVGIASSAMEPDGSITPIAFPLGSVKNMKPSGPVAMSVSTVALGVKSV